MKIFYTCAFSGKTKYQKYYDLVLHTLQSQKIDLRSPELGHFPPPTASDHYLSIRSDINWADAVIIEISHECFQLGHEATLAIQNKKHVLCLSVHEDFSRKINSRYFHGAKYSELNIDDIISEFINSLRHHQFDQRFNFFLSQKQLQTLDLNATKTGLTKSDYLRNLIDKNSP
ncbi:hypothetical protein KBC75_03760 [Candidatus Shapirobacteria bacterium]|nr:hypothetical protein [Candidatus Shapirobacteria bacterium]